MSSVLNKKLRRDIINSKGILFAVISIITVGTGVLIGLGGTYNNLINAQYNYYSRCKMADFWIELKKAPNSSIDDLKSIKGIIELRRRIVFPVIVDIADVSEPLTGTLISMPESHTNVINDIIIRKGNYFTKDKENEVIVSEKFAEARNILPGDFIHLILNGQKKKLYVIGTAISPEYVFATPPGGIAPSNSTYGIFWIKQKFAEDRLGFDGAYNNLIGRLSPEAGEFPDAVIKKIDQKLTPYGIFSSYSLKNQASNQELSSELSSLSTYTVLLPFLFLGVAALTLNVVMQRTAEQQRVIVGTLKALGTDNKNILWIYVKYSLFVGITGGLAGCLLGYWISGGMTVMYQNFYTFPHLANHAYPNLMLISMLCSILFAVMGSWRGVRAMIRLNPAEAMHPPPPPIGGKIMIERWNWFWNKLDFRWQIVLRSIFRNKKRSFVGIICAAMGSSLVFMAFAMADSIEYMVSFEYDKLLHSDYTLSLRNCVDYAALYEARKLPGIVHAEPELSIQCKLSNGQYTKKCLITGLEKNAKLLTPCRIDGTRVKVPGNGLLLTARLAQLLHVKAGDQLDFSTVKGLRKTHKSHVAGVIDSTFGLTVYTDYEYFNRLINENGAISVLQLKAGHSPAELKSFLKEIKKYPQLASLTIIKKAKQHLNETMVAELNTIVYAIVIFAAIIFLGSILNSALISVSEQKQELATLRALGFTPGETGRIFLRNTFIINITGSILGIPIGYYFNYATSLMIRNDTMAMPCYVDFSAYVWTISLSLLFIFLAYLIIQKSINRMQWLEALNVKA